MNNDQNEKALADTLLDLGARNIAPQLPGVGGIPFVIIPQGMKLQGLESLLPPARIKRAVKLLEAGSFADYVNKFKSPETLIFVQVSETGATFVAMLDYHSAAPELKPAFCDHTATFAAVETPEWKVWKAANRNAMNQVDFATWLEDNSKLLVDPSGSDLLELVRTLHGHQNARFNTSLRLDNGASSVSYDEDVVVKGNSVTRGGDFELPPLIKAGIAVFQGAEPYEVAARLKTRIQDRRLMLVFETVAMHEIIRESILLLTSQISEKTGLVPLIGNA